MVDKKEDINCSGDPCIWCCFPCLFTMAVCENCCKAICMFICCVQPDSVKPNNHLSIVIPSKEKETGKKPEKEKEYYADMFSTNIK